MIGIDVAQSTVAKYMARRRGPPSQSCKTLLKNHADGIASCDFMIVPTIGFKMRYAFIVLGHGRRKLLHLAVADKKSVAAILLTPTRRHAVRAAGRQRSVPAACSSGYA